MELSDVQSVASFADGVKRLLQEASIFENSET